MSRRLASAVLVAALAAAPLAATPYEKGDHVVITGIVTDAGGLPIDDVQVTLEASRSYFDLRHFARATKDTTRLSAVTNDRGEYGIEWLWDGYYNFFELVVSIPVRKPGGEQTRELDRVDITRRIERGSPVVTSLVVEDSAFLKTMRAFIASLQTDDERRVYGEMGNPDKVERVDYSDRREASWWYFESGKVYRFRDGKLVQIVPFDPVKGFIG